MATLAALDLALRGALDHCAASFRTDALHRGSCEVGVAIGLPTSQDPRASERAGERASGEVGESGPGTPRVTGRASYASATMGDVPARGGFRNKIYRDDAVVLRCQKLGESDRIVTMFTRRHGRIRAVAKGVRRTTSKFGARLEPFGHIDVQISESRSSLHTVAQVEGIDLFGKNFVGDYPRYTTASAIVET